jgi:Esterase-like activity of phytase
MGRWLAPLVAVLGGACTIGCAGASAPPPLDADHPLTASLPAIPLASFQNQALPGSLADDHGMRLGGFSDLYHDPRDGTNVFWTVPDRGPTVAGEKGLTHAVPEYNPALVKLMADASGTAVLQQIPISTPDGQPVSGLPNAGETAPLGPDGELLAFNPNGLDPEGIVRVPDGTFWLAEEYGPSLVHLSRDGRVLERWMPRGRRSPGAAYPVAEVLPAALGRRQPDRGLESLAVTGEGRFLYTMMEATLSPARPGESPRPVRILQVDTLLARTVSQWVYLPEAPSDGASDVPSRMTALSFVNSGTLLAVEETGAGARLYSLDLGAATSVLGGAYDPPAGGTLDDMDAAALARADIRPVSKSLLLDLGRAAGPESRIEGLAIVDADTIAISTDDGFGLATPKTLLGFAASAAPPTPPAASRLVTIRLGEALPLGR